MTAVHSADAHPLHTTLAQVTYNPGSGEMVASIRAFAGDLAAAVAKRKGGTVDGASDAASLAYLGETFQLTDAFGHAIAWSSCGVRREGDVIFLCVRAAHVPPSAKLADQMLCELFDDQVNIVQAAAGDKKSSNLFTKGDGAKPVL